ACGVAQRPSRALQGSVRKARRGAHQPRLRLCIEDHVTASRRAFLASAAAAALPFDVAHARQPPDAPVAGTAHWTVKQAGADKVKLFLWRKRASEKSLGTILFVHGSSVSATPVFDLQIKGKPEASTMDWFRGLGYD